ncbi:MAG: T9SS type A sorting domain-containing protein [Candidatus Electryonea clarkiae]|nr:T9SS type A sorting domain-containing protein [Candidatus Electryonea clarkiae]MDP8289069.1 T9SS type A sorting domain-containing protein [Candidatus Electryonea clarkiae]
MLKRTLLVFIACLILFNIPTTEIFAENYPTGALREAEMPAWIIPSPMIQLDDGRMELDESCDNSDGLPPVGNQGQQGSCTAWATAYYYLTYLQGQEYDWDLTEPENQCSPAFTYNMINGGIDGGSYPSDAFLLFENMGCSPYSEMPYSDRNYTLFPSEDAFLEGMQFRTYSTYTINTQNRAGLTSLKNHLLNGHIAATAMTVWMNFQNIDDFDYTYCVSDIYGTDPGGHAVTIIGFDDNRETSDGTGAFKMVNSWGGGWGDGGFWWMSYEAMMHRSIGWGYALYASDRLDYEATLVGKVEINHTDRYSLQYGMGTGQPSWQGQTLVFNEFSIGSRAYRSFPESPLVLDLTDLYDNINEDDATDFFLRILDRNGHDVHFGSIQSLMIEDVQREHYAISQDTPVNIPDNYNDADATVVFHYSVVPPENLEAAIDLSDGNVRLTWDALDELNDFIEYVILRDGEEIGTTEESDYTDELPTFGVYSYSILSRWDECPSWQTDNVEVNWVEPVIPRYTTMWSVDGESGDFNLTWEQLRDHNLVNDDGIHEADLRTSESALPGMMISTQFSAPADGKVLRIGAYLLANEEGEFGRIRLQLFHSGNNNLPGEEFYRSPVIVPREDGWYWLDLGGARMSLDGADIFWVALRWEELCKTSLGRDTNGEQIQIQAVAPDGENWAPFTILGNLMIRADYGEEEISGGWTGLQGFNVYRDGNLLGQYESDEHRAEGRLASQGQYEFQVDAVYEQGIWEGEALSFDWNGENLEVIDSELPLEWKVGTPYPNPFNSTITIGVELPKTSPLKIEVFNLLGQQVALIANDHFQPGSYRLSFSAPNLPSGIYLLRVNALNYSSETRKIVLMK